MMDNYTNGLSHSVVKSSDARAVDADTRILFVIHSEAFSRLAKESIVARTGATVVVTHSLAAAKFAVEQSDPYHFAVVDSVLPDCKEGEAEDWLYENGIPCIQFGDEFSDDLYERQPSQKIIDHVVKGSASSVEYLTGLVERLHRNRGFKVLLVDDSKAARSYVGDLLTSYQFQVTNASTGREGLEALASDPDIRLIITDYYMPEMNGVEMVQKIRQIYDHDRLAIIGISSGGGTALSAKFIRYGANDFIIKPFIREEFFCRVMQNVRMLDLVHSLSDLATKDPLTGIHNRRFLFEVGESLFHNAARNSLHLTVAMVDIDHFKSVNDTYGHATGDAVLKSVGSLLRRLSRQSDIVVRFGGEEFVILTVNMEPGCIPSFFNNLRTAIESERTARGGVEVSVTASFGICCGAEESLETMLRLADEMLYRAKSKGRNRIEIAERDVTGYRLRGDL